MSDLGVVDPPTPTGRRSLGMPSRIVRARTVEGPLIRRKPPGPLDDREEFDDEEDDDTEYLDPDESIFNPSMAILFTVPGLFTHGVARDALAGAQYQGYVVQPFYRVQNPDESESEVPIGAHGFLSTRTYSPGKWNWALSVQSLPFNVDRMRVDFRFGSDVDVSEVQAAWGGRISGRVSRTGSSQTTGPEAPRLFLTLWLTDEEVERREADSETLEVTGGALTVFVWRVDEVPEDEEDDD